MILPKSFIYRKPHHENYEIIGGYIGHTMMRPSDFKTPAVAGLSIICENMS